MKLLKLLIETLVFIVGMYYFQEFVLAKKKGGKKLGKQKREY